MAPARYPHATTPKGSDPVGVTTLRRLARASVTIVVVCGALLATLLAASCAAEVPPVQNVDHWRIPYGVWSCTLGDGDGDWLPAFDSTDDPLGIHSHGDGVISIHPFLAESAGRNAVFGHFIDSMRAELNDERLVIEDGTQFREDEPCPDGEDPVLHLRIWSSADPDGDPRLVTDNLTAARFVSDHEIWAVVHAPLTAELPRLPRDRIEADW